MKIDYKEEYNFLFHPLSEDHPRNVKILSTITIVALSIFTAGIFFIAFVIINLKDRRIKVLDKNCQKIKVPNPQSGNTQDLKTPDIKSNPSQNKHKDNPVNQDPPVKQDNQINSDKSINHDNPTAFLLSNPFGFTYSAKEPGYHTLVGHIGPIQGHDKFRSEVAKITKKDIHALSPKAIRENRAVNPKLSLILTTKRLGHTLSLGGDIYLENTNVNLGGFNEVFTIPMIADSFKMFTQKNPELVNEEMSNWILTHFVKSTRHDDITEQDIDSHIQQLKDPQFKGPLCVSTGYDWHVTFNIFFKQFVFSMNRGTDSFALEVEGKRYVDEFSGPGISIFKTPKLFFDLSKETATKMFKRMTTQRWNAANVNTIQKELGLQFLDIKKSKTQKAPNCTYVSTKLAIHTLIALYFLRNHERITPHDFDDAFKNAKSIYKRWVAFDRNYVVEDLVEEIKTLENANQKDTFIYRNLLQLLNRIHPKKHKLDPRLASEVTRLGQ